MLLMENGNRREVSGHLMGKKCKNCCILMGKRIFAEAAPVSRYAVMLVTASLIAACKYLHRGLLMYGPDLFQPIPTCPDILRPVTACHDLSSPDLF